VKKILAAVLLLVLVPGMALAQGGTKKRRPLPYEYGEVIIGSHSGSADLAPTVFDHWLHRAKYTCRVCHVDVGFAMKANATGIRAADNIKGYYCGTCHNGKTMDGTTKIFEACSTNFTRDDVLRCKRCHSLGEKIKKETDFTVFTKRFPKERFGNGIDWEKADEQGLIKPLDFIEGVSIKRPSLAVQKDFSISAKVESMPDIIFSHKKHTVWNGCELCHPEIFAGIRKGTTKYSMVDIFEGNYCGACHKAVAFPTTDCQRCHTKPVK
jgi:c(7)-type cytochrome triheme protein